jgi:ATP-dependent protease HslVU (ClpYQ) peptidase subunit
MSVVVAIKKDGVVYMGADSQVSRGGTRMTLSNPNNYKIWSLCDVDRSLMGSVGSLRTNNIIKVADNLVPETIDIKDAVDFRFVVKSLVPHLMDELNEYNALSKDRDDMPNMDSEFLFAYHDRLYYISAHGSVVEVDDFHAIGSGSNEALGSLLSTASEEDPVKRIQTAIKASAARDIYVDYPIIISNTENTKYNVFYEKDL